MKTTDIRRIGCWLVQVILVIGLIIWVGGVIITGQLRWNPVNVPELLKPWLEDNIVYPTEEQPDSVRAEPTVSPLLALFRNSDFSLPSQTEIRPVYMMQLRGQEYTVLAYESIGGSGIQIQNGERLLTDADIAYQVLLSYAWTREGHGIDTEQEVALGDLLLRMQQFESTYAAVFELAHSLGPVIELIDDLQDRPINGIPLIAIGGFPLVDITNLWDLICTIPVNAADLCILEPLVRALHDEGKEIERLIRSAAGDLNAVMDLLDEQKQGNVQEGLKFKIAFERAISSQKNLLWKLEYFGDKVFEAQATTRAFMDVVENRDWDPRIDRILQAADKYLPGFQSSTSIQGLAQKLRALDEKMDNYLAQVDGMIGYISPRTVILEDARFQANEQLRNYGAAWRTRPLIP